MPLFNEEVWVPVSGHDGYFVSNLGRVKSVSRYVDGKLGSKRLIKGGYMKQYLNKDGYCVVELNNIQYRVHRLVAMAFIPNPENKKEVNHKDRCRHNNLLSNLEWVTLQENQLHSWENGRIGNMNGKSGFLHNKSHPIVQIENGNIVATYGSIKEAARNLSVNDSVIGQAIKRGAPISKRSHKLYGISFEKI